jgi:hypothetical protein
MVKELVLTNFINRDLLDLKFAWVYNIKY